MCCTIEYHAFGKSDHMPGEHRTGKENGTMAEQEEKKQMDVIDVQDKLWPIRSKDAFLESIMLPQGAEEPLKLSQNERIGLGLILGDIHARIEEITDAEIVSGVANG